MGLAGRKQKQRIPNDPRNLSWADDANKFGTAYLQKLGWSAGSGLGASGDGRTTHIKVHQKLDMLGVGAAHQKDPNGIAWKQNKDFENLLRRLNADSGDAGEDVAVSKIDGFAKATESKEEEAPASEVAEAKESKKKRKRDKEDDKSKGRKKSKKSSDDESKLDKKEKKKSKSKSKQKEDEDASTEPAEGITPSPAALKTTLPASIGARPLRVHRARFLASKRLASKSSTAIDEILGISRSATATPYPSGSIPSTPLDTTTSSSLEDGSSLSLEKLTTSTKSVMDYFKEKLLAKSSGLSTPPTSTSTSRAVEKEDDYEDQPRDGLGLGFGRAGLGAGSSSFEGGIGSSGLRSEGAFTETTTTENEGSSGRAGLGIFSQMSAMFASATSQGDEETVEVEAVDLAVEQRKKKKSKKGKERRDEDEDIDVNVEEVSEKKKKKKSRKQKESDDEPCGERASKEKSKKKKKERAVDVALESEGQMDVVATKDKLPKKERKEKKSKKKVEEVVVALVEEIGPKKKKKKEKSSKPKDTDED